MAAFRRTDVTSLADLEATVAFAVERWGGLDRDLRGLYMRVVEAGEVGPGDAVEAV